VFSRQALPIVDRSRFGAASGARRGAYVLLDSSGGEPEIILIGTGSEVALCVAAADQLSDLKVRVVSMPSWELFAQQPQAYRDEVLPPSVTTRLAVEAASPLGWERWVGADGDVVGLNRFGASAPYQEVFKHLNFTPEFVAQRARDLLERGGQRDGSGVPPSTYTTDRASAQKAGADRH
jgi:transketolase